MAGAAGVAVSYALAGAMAIRTAPLVAIADLVIRLTPGSVSERVIQLLGHHDKPFLVATVLVLGAAMFAAIGLLARRTLAGAEAALVLPAVLGGIAVADEHGATMADQLPVVAGLVTWLVALPLITLPLRGAAERIVPDDRAGSDRSEGARSSGTTEVGRSAASRRDFLLRVGAVAAGAAVVGVAGRALGSGRRQVEAARRLLRLPWVTAPQAPAGTAVDVPGMPPWATPSSQFYRVDTAIVVPTVEPRDWQLRIHGMVDREVVVSYQDLVHRRTTEAWVTLTCVSNDVGGNLVGNAWWSGVRVADLLREAGVQPGADAVLQTSADGWTCGTPLGTLTDGRDAMLAVAMNGRPLPIDHGFPVRTVVPGLYGYVSACKWVVDLEVTRFSQIAAFWTQHGWSELGPIKMSSRIDVPRAGAHVPAGSTTVAGVAWAQHTGIKAVEVSVDGGSWQPARLASVPSADTWVQWVATVALDAGQHTLAVRATDANGLVQTGVEHGAVPNGATGWHTIGVTAT